MRHKLFVSLTQFVPFFLTMFIFTGTGVTQSTSLISQLAYAPQNDILAVGLFNQTVELWDLSSEQLIAVAPTPLSNSEAVTGLYAINDMRFSPDGNLLAVSYGGYDNPGILQIILSSSGMVIHTFTAGNYMGDLAWSPDGSQLAVKMGSGFGAVTSGYLLVWEIPSGNQIVNVYIGANTNSIGLDWSPDGTQLVSVHLDNLITLWNTSTWSMASLQLMTDNTLTDVAWNGDGSRIIAVDDQRTLYVWDGSAGTLLYYLSILPLGNLYDIDVYDNQVVINGLTEILIWDINSVPIFRQLPTTFAVADVIWLNGTTIMHSDETGFVLKSVLTTHSFTLINAEMGGDISPLNENDAIDLTALGTSNLAIRANTIPSAVGSVVFDLNGLPNVQTDDTAPYDLTNWTPAPGQYTLTATPYSEAGGAGTAGSPLTISFTVTEAITCDLAIPASDSAALIAAIESANSAGSSQTLCLEAGMYTFSAVHNSTEGPNALPVITGDVTLRGVGVGASLVRAETAPALRFFSIATGGSLTLENLTLSAGYTSGDGGAIYNRGIVQLQNTLFNHSGAGGSGGAVYNTGTLTITAGSFGDNWTDGTGGVVYSTGTLSVANSSFEANWSGVVGGVIYNSGTLSIANSSFTLNGTDGSGGVVYNTGTATVQDSHFASHWANGGSGGVVYNTGTMTIIGSNFSDSWSSSGGGVIASSAELTINTSLFQLNSSGGMGGVVLSSGDLSISSSHFVGNWSESDGGVVYSSANLGISDGTSFTGNAAAGHGGVIYSSGSAEIATGIFEDNGSHLDGGTLYSTGAAVLVTSDFAYGWTLADGGALYSSGTLSISDSQFTGNWAGGLGGSLRTENATVNIDTTDFQHNSSSGSADSQGGVIYQNGGSLTIVNSHFENNGTLGSGGVVYSNSELNASSSQFIESWASVNGGVIYSSGNLTVSGGNLVANWSGSAGGGLYGTETSALNLSDSVLVMNSSDGNGGGIYTAGNLSITHSTLFENYTEQAGGGIYNLNDLFISASMLSNNVALTGGGIYSQHGSATASINSSCMEDNYATTAGAIYSATTGFVAINNWWGMATGPTINDVNEHVDTSAHLVACPNQSLTSQPEVMISAVETEEIAPILNLPATPRLERSTMREWQINGLWDLVRVEGRTGWTWLVDARPRQHESVLELASPIDLGSVGRPQLHFTQRLELNRGDVFTVEVLPLHSSTWQVVQREHGRQSDWQMQTVGLNRFRGQVVRLRFRLVTGTEVVSTSVLTGVWLDSLSVNDGGR